MTKFKINNKNFCFNEIPNTDDKEVLEFLVYLQELYDICRNLLLNLAEENKKIKTTIGFVGSIIDRISESIISIILLSSKGFSRDVAIILVNIIELRTDLKYISNKPEKIEEWFNHKNLNKKPWKISHQIKEIVNSEEELKREKNIYEICSIAKHGNPAGYDTGFNIGLKGNGIFIYPNNNNSKLPIYLYWTFVYISDSIKSSLNIVSKFSIEPSKILNDLEEVSKKVNVLSSRIISNEIMDYINKSNLELRNNGN